MSGIEFIIATVLAAVPIALEAYDRSNRVFEVFAVFRQYPREVLTLEAKLSAQRTIFRNNAINLLRAITRDQAAVQEVMSQPSSKSLRECLVQNPAYQLRQDALEESFMTCHQTAQQIQHALEQLYLHAEAFGADLGQRQEVSRLFLNIGTNDKVSNTSAEYGYFRLVEACEKAL
jgi:tRNA threonylcarbamoyladenosine modification (KEOPS) complex  Pcc1 subunit